MRPRFLQLSAMAVLILAVWAVFGQVGSFSFSTFDDDVYVTQNPHVQEGMTREALTWAFVSTRSGHWHPVTWFSHMLDWQGFGLDPGGHHMVNLLIHLVNTFLLLHILVRMTGAFWRSFLVAALFALHPLHAETVAWVADRKDLLCAGFMLLALRAYARYARSRGVLSYGLSLCAFALALMSKAMAVTLPLLLLLLDRWPLERTRVQGAFDSAGKGLLRGWGPLFLEKLPFLVLGLGASLTALAFMGGQGGEVPDVHPLGVRLQAALAAYGHFLVKTVWPTDLAVLYPLRPDIPAGETAVTALALAGISLVAFRWRERVPYAFTGWFWFVIGVAPVSGLLYLGVTPMADRYTYVPLIGLFIAAAWGAEAAAGRLVSARTGKALLTGLGAVLLILMAILCRQQTATWRDDGTLFAHAVRVSPASALAHNNFGLDLASRGENTAAERHFREAARLSPRMASAHRNLGISLARQGRIPETEAALRRALRLQPGDAEVRSYLARCFLVQGRFEKAESECRKALNVAPDHARAWVNLGEALLKQGRVQAAEEAYRNGFQGFDGDRARLLSGLATALAVQGRLNEAVGLRRQVVAARPDSGEAWYRLAVESFLLGDFASAVRHCDRAQSLGYKGVESAFLERLEPYRKERGANAKPGS